jgi:hypothetical protein
MVSSVLAATLLSALNPMHFALTVFVMSRPRPLQNLLAFWAGCLTGAIPALLIPLTLMHVTPVADSIEDGLGDGPAAGYVSIVIGVVLLTIGAVMTARTRHSATMPARGASGRHRQASTGTTTTLLDRDPPPSVIERLIGPSDQPVEGRSLFHRLLRNLRRSWENGALWVAYVIGLAFGGPQPDLSLFVIAVLMASGAAIGVQVALAAVFVLGTLGIIEIILLSYLITPSRTQAVARMLHDWVTAHRRKIVVSTLVVVGVVLVAQGIHG